MKCIIYHNKKCSKSRETLELLQNRGLDPTIIEYLKNSPKVDELEKIISKLKIHPKQLVRFKENKAKELGISERTLYRKIKQFDLQDDEDE